jgi:hypothetical protein
MDPRQLQAPIHESLNERGTVCPDSVLPNTKRAWDSRVALQSQGPLGPGSTVAHLCKQRRKGGASLVTYDPETAGPKLGQPPGTWVFECCDACNLVPISFFSDISSADVFHTIA